MLAQITLGWTANVYTYTEDMYAHAPDKLASTNIYIYYESISNVIYISMWLVH